MSITTINSSGNDRCPPCPRCQSHVTAVVKARSWDHPAGVCLDCEYHWELPTPSPKSDPMDQTRCQNCGKVGLVRQEHIIKGSTFTKAFYCGGCEHQWSVADTPPPAPVYPQPPKPRTRRYGPKQRGR